MLIDEIGRGTSTFDGLALAWAIARELATKNRSLTLFATHYFELTALPARAGRLRNVHFDAVEHKEGIVFLHAVEEGAANRSYGLQVAKLAGVPPIRSDKRGATSPDSIALAFGTTAAAICSRRSPIRRNHHPRAPQCSTDLPRSTSMPCLRATPRKLSTN